MIKMKYSVVDDINNIFWEKRFTKYASLWRRKSTHKKRRKIFTIAVTWSDWYCLIYEIFKNAHSFVWSIRFHSNVTKRRFVHFFPLFSIKKRSNTNGNKNFFCCKTRFDAFSFDLWILNLKSTKKRLNCIIWISWTLIEFYSWARINNDGKIDGKFALNAEFEL